MSLTRDLEIHVSAEHLTDPDTARRLAYALPALVEHERSNGDHSTAGFLTNLAASLEHFATELERTHDQVVRAVTATWEPTLDDGPIDDDSDEDDGPPTHYRHGGGIDGVK
jgi:hypothetical protein